MARRKITEWAFVRGGWVCCFILILVCFLYITLMPPTTYYRVKEVAVEPLPKERFYRILKDVNYCRDNLLNNYLGGGDRGNIYTKTFIDTTESARLTQTGEVDDDGFLITKLESSTRIDTTKVIIIQID